MIEPATFSLSFSFPSPRVQSAGWGKKMGLGPRKNTVLRYRGHAADWPENGISITTLRSAFPHTFDGVAAWRRLSPDLDEMLAGWYRCA